MKRNSKVLQLIQTSYICILLLLFYLVIILSLVIVKKKKKNDQKVTRSISISINYSYWTLNSKFERVTWKLPINY